MQPVYAAAQQAPAKKITSDEATAPNGAVPAKEEQEKIFNMFTQLNDPAKFGGTGVGLAIVKKAMEIMHGSVGVESTDDSGSRFWLELPKA